MRTPFIKAGPASSRSAWSVVAQLLSLVRSTSSKHRTLILLPAILAALCTLAGCETMAKHPWGPENPFGPLSAMFDDGTEFKHAADKRRERYLEHRDAKSLRWLLANCVRSGMSVAEVSHELGEDGQREFNDMQFKNHGSKLQADDIVYRWGPDNEGNNYYFGFRNDKLLNFNPDEFRS